MNFLLFALVGHFTVQTASLSSEEERDTPAVRIDNEVNSMSSDDEFQRTVILDNDEGAVNSELFTVFDDNNNEDRMNETEDENEEDEDRMDEGGAIIIFGDQQEDSGDEDVNFFTTVVNLSPDECEHGLVLSLLEKCFKMGSQEYIRHILAVCHLTLPLRHPDFTPLLHQLWEGKHPTSTASLQVLFEEASTYGLLDKSIELFEKNHSLLHLMTIDDFRMLKKTTFWTVDSVLRLMMAADEVGSEMDYNAVNFLKQWYHFARDISHRWTPTNNKNNSTLNTLIGYQSHRGIFQLIDRAKMTKGEPLTTFKINLYFSDQSSAIYTSSPDHIPKDFIDGGKEPSVNLLREYGLVNESFSYAFYKVGNGQVGMERKGEFGIWILSLSRSMNEEDGPFDDLLVLHDSIWDPTVSNNPQQVTIPIPTTPSTHLLILAGNRRILSTRFRAQKLEGFLLMNDLESFGDNMDLWMKFGSEPGSSKEPLQFLATWL